MDEERKIVIMQETEASIVNLIESMNEIIKGSKKQRRINLKRLEKYLIPCFVNNMQIFDETFDLDYCQTMDYVNRCTQRIKNREYQEAERELRKYLPLKWIVESGKTLNFNPLEEEEW